MEDFTRRKYNGKQIPVRVYTTRGLKEQGRFGLQNAHQIVDYFSEVSSPNLGVCYMSVDDYLFLDLSNRLPAS